MKIGPLVHLASMRIPALTDIFSDILPATSMTVEAGGICRIMCSAAHGGVPGQTKAITIVDSITPNPIIDLELLDNDDVLVTTQFEHELTTTPDATLYEAWDGFATIAGTGVTGLDGNRQLVSVDSTTTFVVRPGGSVTLPPSIPSGAAHMARLERQLTGWHNAAVESSTVLTIPTPATVTRDYTVTAPKIATNVRVWGGVNLDSALAHFTRANENDVALEGRGWMFICPIPEARLSRDNRSTSDAIAELQPAQVVRQHLLDGFEVYVALPAEKHGGGVACLDRANGPVLRAVMRTFNGLRLPYTEFAMPDPFLTIMSSHGTEQYTRANYVHRYAFEATLLITDQDMAAPIDIPDLTAFDAAIINATSPPLDPLQPVGSVPFTGPVSFSPDPAYGLWQSDKPQPLVANFTLPPA